MKPITVCCSHCKGTGKIELTGIYLDTLTLLRDCTLPHRLPGEITGADLARIYGCKAEAMNNRLDALERMGLATSRRYGRQRLFKAKESP